MAKTRASSGYGLERTAEECKKWPWPTMPHTNRQEILCELYVALMYRAQGMNYECGGEAFDVGDAVLVEDINKVFESAGLDINEIN